MHFHASKCVRNCIKHYNNYYTVILHVYSCTHPSLHHASGVRIVFNFLTVLQWYSLLSSSHHTSARMPAHVYIILCTYIAINNIIQLHGQRSFIHNTILQLHSSYKLYIYIVVQITLTHVASACMHIYIYTCTFCMHDVLYTSCIYTYSSYNVIYIYIQLHCHLHSILYITNYSILFTYTTSIYHNAHPFILGTTQ